jgi:hypothetical protein
MIDSDSPVKIFIEPLGERKPATSVVRCFLGAIPGFFLSGKGERNHY